MAVFLRLELIISYLSVLPCQLDSTTTLMKSLICSFSDTIRGGEGGHSFSRCCYMSKCRMSKNILTKLYILEKSLHWLLKMVRIIFITIMNQKLDC